MAAEQIKPAVPLPGIIPDPLQFFASFFKSFQRAADNVGGVIDRYYNLAGQTIRLRFAGPALLPLLTPALAHTAVPETSASDLTICIWDNTSTATPRPKLPPVASMPRGDIPGFNNGRIHTHIGADLFSALDIEQRLAVYWCQDAAQLPLYEKGAPLRSILHWWFRGLDLQLVHAGAVGTASAGVLLAGKGGSGKSTTCLACLNSDLLYVSDDYSLIGLEPGPYVHTLYNTAKVRPDNLHRVPHLEDKIANSGSWQQEKALFFLQEHFPQKVAAGMPLHAIFLPRVTGKIDTSLSPATARDSLSALLLSTMHQLAGSDEKTVVTIQRLVNTLPSYHLHLGTDLEQIPIVINNHLQAKQ